MVFYLELLGFTLRIKDFDIEQKKIVQTIYGIFTNTKKDAHNEKLTLEALEKAKTGHERYPFVFHEHDLTKPPIGIVTHTEIRKIENDEYELYGEVGIFDKEYIDLIKNGKIRSFSVSFTTGGNNKNE